MYALFACPGVNVFPSYSTVLNGLPLAKIARPYKAYTVIYTTKGASHIVLHGVKKAIVGICGLVTLLQE